ncbi:chemotaxis protein CheW [Shewanella xiamenensis]|jgi:purine-binding chemotaxis protein CheW|uniref:Chemotaxis protein CheW n=1 Tax=Shewanella xiamenensis TaxID=332186 RepID=A0AAW6QVG7_9GAMM|nr:MULTISPECIES: chemotaxis protein CheW [Shewanella]PZP28624.1 MAG: chemotaxis protein CheW [Shewanella oneidensis]AVL27108.1 chemotaxis protein CheW [Shewanella sp. FDAARGOS_354]MBW0281554.1 chemotaxis protein CheW [Shewanella xiamenensis]MBW0298655.1 chemotaxis protein CheW [Shewanella xiamenensis]MCD8549535.1 chemotaxis protein CheW [Shewanella xiamenensis]
MNQLVNEMKANSVGDITQYLTFQSGNDTFAIGILDVKEIIEIEGITRVPMMPEFLCGIINLRGKVVPVIDLSKRLGRLTTVISKKSCIVLVEVSHEDEQQTIGMLVDEVNEILEIDDEHTQPPPDFGADLRVDFIRAMGRVGEHFMILLDINYVLSVADISAISQLNFHAADATDEAL